MFASRLSHLTSLGYAFTFRKTIYEDIIQIEVYKDGRHAEERIDRRNVKDAGLDVETFFDYVLLDLVSLVDERTIAEEKEEITFYADGLASTETVAIRVKERGEDREGSSNQ